MKKNVLKFSFFTSSRRVLYLGHFVLCNTLSVYHAFLLFLKLSVRNSVWSQKRGQMSESAVKDLVYCSLNPQVSFAVFYEEKKTKNTKPFLRKVHNIEKFELMNRKPCNQ